MILDEKFDRGVYRLAKARESRAVSKMRLIKLREYFPSGPIFVVEGKEDKIVYSAWIRILNRDIKYEFFVSGGKRQVLDIRDAMQKDLNGLNRELYYFIDRDFDDYSDDTAASNTFITDMHSVENYLVHPDVVDAIVRIELNLDIDPTSRQKILELFDCAYSQFLEVTAEHNWRMFFSIRVGVNKSKGLPETVNQLAIVSIDRVFASDRSASDLIQLDREPTAQEVDCMRPVFDSMSRPERFRGKFCIAFLYKWLDCLFDELSKPRSDLISSAIDAKIRRPQLTLNSLAMNSPIPRGLDKFLTGVGTGSSV